MKHFILTIICTFMCMSASAYETMSQLIDKATPVDTARYKVTYALKYKYHPKYRITTMTPVLCRLVKIASRITVT